MWFFPDRQYAHFIIARPYIRLGFKICGIKVKVEGLRNIPKDKNFIIMSNHQSLLDIPILMLVIPRKFSFIAKKQLFRIPILGWDLKLQGHFGIDRENPRKAVRQMAHIKQEVQNGRSLLIFPEGTRTIDGSLHPFKRGGFTLAAETGTTILPVRLTDMHKIINKKSFKLTPGTVTIKFHKPIPIQKLPKSQAKDRAKNLMEETKKILTKS